MQNHSREVLFAPIALLLPQLLHTIHFYCPFTLSCFCFPFNLNFFLRKPSVCRKPLLKALRALHKHEKNNHSVKEEEEKWTWVRSYKWSKTITTIWIHKILFSSKCEYLFEWMGIIPMKKFGNFYLGIINKTFGVEPTLRANYYYVYGIGRGTCSC